MSWSRDGRKDGRRARGRCLRVVPGSAWPLMVALMLAPTRDRDRLNASLSQLARFQEGRDELTALRRGGYLHDLGKVLRIDEAGAPPGSCVEVRTLFFNTLTDPTILGRDRRGARGPQKKGPRGARRTPRPVIGPMPCGFFSVRCRFARSS